MHFTSLRATGAAGALGVRRARRGHRSARRPPYGAQLSDKKHDLKGNTMMTTTNELAEAVATALEKAEHQKSLSPTQRMSSGYEARDRALSEALAKEEHLAGRPLDRREERAVRRSLDGGHR